MMHEMFLFILQIPALPTQGETWLGLGAYILWNEMLRRRNGNGKNGNGHDGAMEIIRTMQGSLSLLTAQIAAVLVRQGVQETRMDRLEDDVDELKRHKAC